MKNIKIPRPTIAWTEELNEGSDFYTADGIAASDKLLDTYLAKLDAAKNETAIWRAIEEVVKGFDKVAVEHDGFIETMEREDLAAYIQAAAEAAGLIYDGDVTEEWREEW